MITWQVVCFDSHGLSGIHDVVVHDHVHVIVDEIRSGLVLEPHREALRVVCLQLALQVK